MFHEVMETTNKVFIRTVSKIQKAWLLEYAADFYRVV